MDALTVHSAAGNKIAQEEGTEKSTVFSALEKLMMVVMLLEPRGKVNFSLMSSAF